MSNAVAVSRTLVLDPGADVIPDHCEFCENADSDDECEGIVLGPDPTMIVERWHNDEHSGGFRFCDQQPCYAINWAVDR